MGTLASRAGLTRNNRGQLGVRLLARMAGWHPSKRQPLPGNELLWRACVQLQMMVRVMRAAPAPWSRHGVGSLTARLEISRSRIPNVAPVARVSSR